MERLASLPGEIVAQIFDLLDGPIGSPPTIHVQLLAQLPAHRALLRPRLLARAAAGTVPGSVEIALACHDSDLLHAAAKPAHVLHATLPATGAGRIVDRTLSPHVSSARRRLHRDLQTGPWSLLAQAVIHGWAQGVRYVLGLVEQRIDSDTVPITGPLRRTVLEALLLALRLPSAAIRSILLLWVRPSWGPVLADALGRVPLEELSVPVLELALGTLARAEDPLVLQQLHRAAESRIRLRPTELVARLNTFLFYCEASSTWPARHPRRPAGAAGTHAPRISGYEATALRWINRRGVDRHALKLLFARCPRIPPVIFDAAVREIKSAYASRQLGHGRRDPPAKLLARACLRWEQDRKHSRQPAVMDLAVCPEPIVRLYSDE